MLDIALGTAVVAALLGCVCYGSRLGTVIRFQLMGVRALVEDRLHASSNRTDCPQMPGRVAIVTGGSRGIGIEIVRMLLQCDMDVVIACRRTSAGEDVVRSIRDAGVVTGNAKVIELDTSSFDSVKKFVKEFNNFYDKLDILINNAGIGLVPYKKTDDGFEEQYQVNYLSHFLLTILMIPLLKKASTPGRCSRIVNVSSSAHLLADIDFENINQDEDDFITQKAYSQSKLAQVLSTKKLARIFKEKQIPIRIHAVHPGVVATDAHGTAYMRIIADFMFKSPMQGAIPVVNTAVDSQLEEKSGLYISNCLEAPTNPLADDEALQDKFFELSIKQCRLENDGLQ